MYVAYHTVYNQYLVIKKLNFDIEQIYGKKRVFEEAKCDFEQESIASLKQIPAIHNFSMLMMTK